MVRVTQIHMAGGTGHEHIQSVRWVNTDDSSKTGQNTTPEMVDWIESKKGRVIVSDGRNTVDVRVVDAKPKYLRTYADGKWTDNLLALPRY